MPSAVKAGDASNNVPPPLARRKAGTLPGKSRKCTTNTTRTASDESGHEERACSHGVVSVAPDRHLALPTTALKGVLAVIAFATASADVFAGSKVISALPEG